MSGKTHTSDLESRYRRITDNNILLAIVHSPSYRLDAQELARKLLFERGVSEEAISQWRDPSAEFADPPWLRDTSESLRQMFSYRRRVYLRIIYSLIIAIVLSLGMVLPLVFPAILLHGVFWRTPLRILILRPFEFPQSRKLVHRLVQDNLCYLGHIYTLSDSEVRPLHDLPEIHKLLLLVLGVHWRYLWRITGDPLNVRYQEDMPRLMGFVGKRLSRNIGWALSWSKMFKISCIPETWKRAVQYLIHNMDLVIIDLSNAGEGLKWELKELQFYGFMDKVVFVARYDRVSLAQSFLETCMLSECDREVFVYGVNGLATRHKEFNAAIAAAAAWSIASYESSEPSQ